MLAYIFWHVPLPSVQRELYEDALVGFHRHLSQDPPPGFVMSTTYRSRGVPFLGDRVGYEDWCFIETSAALDVLNGAALQGARRDVHAGIASKTDFGFGGLYYHLHGEKLPTRGSRLLWLKRPRGIRYEQPLQDLVSKSNGFLSCWRKQMVLGPADEFAIIGDEALEVSIPQDWTGTAVEREKLFPLAGNRPT